MGGGSGGSGSGGRGGGGRVSPENEKSFAAYVDRNNHAEPLDNYRDQMHADRLQVAMRTDAQGNIISHRVISNKAKIADQNAKYAPYGKTKAETVKNMKKALYG